MSSPVASPLLFTMHGITPTINEDSPKEQDLILTMELMDIMKSCNVLEDYQGLQARAKVIRNIETLFREWLVEMCFKMNISGDVTSKVGGKIFPFGSYHLGVLSKDSDIDALCVAPCFIEREDFFSSFCQKLAAQKEVKDIHVIEGAFVPVIKLTYEGQKLDLIYAMYPQWSVPETVNLLEDSFLRDVDPRCARSFNGYRVTEQILRLVPNVSNFRGALRAIKFWAKQRKIHSNMLGFLGGVSWAILVAKICQFYPNAAVATLVANFFKVYSTWDWGTAVHLKLVEDKHFDLPFWNSKLNRKDSFHLMPIITPSYPQQNTTFNVTQSTLSIITKEFQRGQSIMEEIYKKEAHWSKLFVKEDLKAKYQVHLLLKASYSSDSQRLPWVGLVESRIRVLVGSLEKDPQISLVQADPTSVPGPRKLDNGQEKSATWWLGLCLNEEKIQRQQLDLTAVVQAFTQHVYHSAASFGVLKDGMKISASLKRIRQQASGLKGKKRKRCEQDEAPAKKAKVEQPPAPILSSNVKLSEKPSPSMSSTSTWTLGTPVLDTKTRTTQRGSMPVTSSSQHTSNKDQNATRQDKLTETRIGSLGEKASLCVPSIKRPRSPELETPAKKRKRDLTPDTESLDTTQKPVQKEVTQPPRKFIFLRRSGSLLQKSHPLFRVSPEAQMKKQ